MGKADKRKSREGPLNIRDTGICRSVSIFLGTGEDVALFPLPMNRAVLVADKDLRKK